MGKATKPKAWERVLAFNYWVSEITHLLGLPCCPPDMPEGGSDHALGYCEWFRGKSFDEPHSFFILRWENEKPVMEIEYYYNYQMDKPGPDYAIIGWCGTKGVECRRKHSPLESGSLNA